jgi:S-adenosyl methyltransferase
VTDQPPSSDNKRSPDFEIDTRVTRPARLFNYLAGGAGNFTVDREVAEHVAEGMPGGLDTIRAAVRSVAEFTLRAVGYLVEEAGVRQLLYVGTPVPAGREVHEVAQQAAPDTRVVYVGNDPVVLAHAHTLQRGTPEGATAYVHGSLRAPEEIWEQAKETLDLSRPIAVLVPVTLHLVPDEADPYGIMTRLLDAVPSGSYLMISHATSDIPTEGVTTASERLREALPEEYVVRSSAEIARFFDGLDLVDPGLVQIDAWRPPPVTPTPDLVLPLYGAVGRKR